MTALSNNHKKIHSMTLSLARRYRADGAAHARLLNMARDARFYFRTLRAIGE